MRSFTAAVVVLVASFLAFHQSVLAGHRMPMEDRPIAGILEAARKKKVAEAELAPLRFNAEVLGLTRTRVVMGAAAEVFEPGELADEAESAIAALGCVLTEPKALAALNDVMTGAGAKLAPVPRAFGLAHQGKKTEAATLLAKNIEAAQPLDDCRSMSRDSAANQVSHLTVAVQCLGVFEPKRDLKKEQERLQKARMCQANNRTVG